MGLLIILISLFLCQVEAQGLQNQDLDFKKYWEDRWSKPFPDSPEQQRTYPLSYAFETYRDSLHGKAKQLGIEKAPTCEDCHKVAKWSEILPMTNPLSPVHEDNLGRTCAQCHGESMINARVSEGSMHVKISQRSIIGEPYTPDEGLPPGVTLREEFYFIGPIDMSSLANWFFSLLTIVVMGVFVVIVFFDTFKKVSERRRKKKGGGG